MAAQRDCATRILRSLTRFKNGHTTLKTLAGKLKVDADAILKPLATLEARGMIVVWPMTKDGSMVGIALVSRPEETPAASASERVVLATDVGGIPDTARPLATVMNAERDDWVAPEGTDPADIGFSLEPVIPEGLPYPTLLIGCGMVWKGPAWLAKHPCPGCKGRRIGWAHYCLCCDRYGAGLQLTGSGPVVELPVPAQPTAYRPDATLRGGRVGGRGAPIGRVRSKAG